jgi:hypothetical protein
MHLPARFAAVILTVAPVFVQQRTWRHAELLLIGAILAPGKRTVTSLLRITGLSRERRFTTYHRVLNRAVWDLRAAARLLLGLLITAFVPSGPVVLGIDDTIERRRGKHITAKGIYRDPVRSSKGHFVKASGLRWLSLMLLAPIPWAGRVWALPFLTVLAPSERYCRERGRRHKKLTDWARHRWRCRHGDGWLGARSCCWATAASPPWTSWPRSPGTGWSASLACGWMRPYTSRRRRGSPGRSGARGPRARACRTSPMSWPTPARAGRRSPYPAGMARATASSRSAPAPPSGATPGCRSCRSAFAGASTSDPCGTGSMPPLASMGAAARPPRPLRPAGPALH